MKPRATFIAAIMATTLIALLAAACGGQTAEDTTPIALERAAPTPAPSIVQRERIMFVSDRDGNSEIYTMNADGSAARRLTKHGAIDRNPAWSPDGRRIAFVSNRDGNWDIHAMNADGSDMTRLTNTAAGWQPVWSPDGRRIAFVSGTLLRSGRFASEIYVMNADGTEITRLANDVARRSIPTWSPDGRRIAFVSIRDGNEDIYAVNADGSEITRLTNHAAADWQPAWSPDGQRIAFVSHRDADMSHFPPASEIYSMNADASDLTRLTRNDLVDANPVWSPDGKRIAFSASRGHSRSSIAIMNADGSGMVGLSRGHSPVWSPDGKRIAFADYPERGDNEIYAAVVDGSEITQLTNNDAGDRSPSWRPAP